jgi:hypothetical protein
MPATLGQVIDHHALRMLGQKPGAAVRDGIAQLLGMQLSKLLTQDDALEYWTLRGILTSLLDSPVHMHR